MTSTFEKDKWKGLVRKEWAIQKWSFITIMLTIFVLTLFDVSSFLVGNPNENWFGLEMSRNTWFILHMYMGVFLFMTSLINETKSLDIWLHSTASIGKLIGSKIIFSTFAVGSSLLVSGVLLMIPAFKSGAAWTEAVSLLAMIALLTLNALFLMVLAFSIWSFYQVFYSRIGKYSILVTFLFVMFVTVAWTIIWFTEGFQQVKEFSPILQATKSLPYLHETNVIFGGLMPDKALISVGSLLLYLFISFILFTASTRLFEKKVRL